MSRSGLCRIQGSSAESSAMSAPRWGDTAGPHSGEDEAPIPEGDRRGAGPSRVETRGGEDSGQVNLEGEADLPRTAGRFEQAALRQIVQEVLEGMRQGTIPLPPGEPHRLRQTTGAVGVTAAVSELADLGLQGTSGGRAGPSQTRELQAEGPPVGVPPEQEGVSPALQEIIPPVAGGIERDLQPGDLPPVPEFLLREQVQRLEMELQMAQQAGFRRITPPPLPASGPGLQAGEILMADVPTSQGGDVQMSDQAGNLAGQMLDSQIPTQMRTQAAQAEAPSAAHSAGISPSAVRKPGSWNGSTPFRGFAASLTIYFRATGLAREHWGLAAATFLEAEARQHFLSRLREHPVEQELYDQEGRLEWTFFCRLMEAGAFGEEATDLNRLVNLDQITRSMGSRDLITFIRQVESVMGLLQTDLPDQVKIWFVFRALPPPLQRQVALAPDGSPWATYDAFRQRATRIYMQTPPSYSQALMAPRGILSGANAAIIGQRPMGYLTTGTLGLPLTGEGQAGRPMKQARTQIGAGAASGSGAASSSSRPQILGRRVDPSTSVHQGKAHV